MASLGRHFDPHRDGEIDFTVPLFDEFMKRWIPDLEGLID